MLRPTTGATAMAIEAMVATMGATVATTVERGTLTPLLLLMLMPMLRLTTEATAMAIEAMVATTVATGAMVATTVERGTLMPLLMLMLMLRLTTGATAMATGVMVATGATGAVTGARRLHHFQNSVRVLRIRPNDFKLL